MLFKMPLLWDILPREKKKSNLTIVNSVSYFSFCCSKGFPPSTVPSIYILLYSPLSPVTFFSNTPLPKFWDRLTPYSLCGSSWILKCGILGLQAVGAANLVEWEWGVNGEYDNKGKCVWQNLSNVYQTSFYSWWDKWCYLCSSATGCGANFSSIQRKQNSLLVASSQILFLEGHVLSVTFSNICAISWWLTTWIEYFYEGPS